MKRRKIIPTYTLFTWGIFAFRAAANVARDGCSRSAVANVPIQPPLMESCTKAATLTSIDPPTSRAFVVD